MARVFNGSNQFLFNTSINPDYGPKSFALWFYKDALSADKWVMTQANGVGNYAGLRALSTGYVRSYWRGGDTLYIESSNTYSATSWNHIGGTWGFKRVTGIYLNGVGVTGSLYSNGAETNNLSIGAYYAGTGSNSGWFDGKIAWAAGWNVELDATDFAALAAGISPLLIRPDALYYFAPLGWLDGNNDEDIVGAKTLTAYNSPTWSDDSPAGLIYPSQQIIGVSQGIVTPAVQHARLRIGV